MASIRIRNDAYASFLHEAEHPDPEELSRRDRFLAAIEEKLSAASRPGHLVMEIPDITIPPCKHHPTRVLSSDGRADDS